MDPVPRRTQSRTVLVTGAGTGTGALSSVLLAQAGHRVFASMRDPGGRNAEKARALLGRTEDAPGELSVVGLGVLSEESASAAVDEVVRQADGLVVVHDAAHLLVGVTEAFSQQEVLRAFDVNAVGALRVNRAVLPVTRRQESGLLLWIGSGTTRAVPPSLAPCSAAKAAFDAFAESTAWEVAAYGIETTILMPGVFTHGTAHFADAAFPADTERTAAYDRIAPFLASMGEDTERLTAGGVRADPQIVADEVVRVLGLPVGRRPRRTVADGSDYGAEIINGAAEEPRLRPARRMGVTALLDRL
ncbi:SDR family NAD(P)-dependent oxidoreductase [Streptomyces olivaceoviridis]|uniref:SDR family NAD(P)-dependent oxidoreductase n=1 Tax=Streptomyces olivaceoviridis TaxID=1921 RepID=UPI0036FABA55